MTRAITAALLAVGGSPELSILVKATVVLALTLVVLRLARDARASLRHVILAAMFGVLMALPIAVIFSAPIALSIPMTPAPRAITRSRGTADPEPRIQPMVDTNAESRTITTSGRWMSRSAAVRGGWIVGAVVFLVPIAFSVAQSRRIRRTGLPWADGERLLRAVAVASGCRRRVRVLLHEDVVVPMTSGCVRPTIMLPTDAAEWSADDIRRALVHELEHVRRFDWPARLAARFVCAMYWFHPLIWVAWRQLCLASEHACDDAVLRSAERTAYADQLVKLARRLANRRANAALSIAGRGDLAARITAVLNINQSRGDVGPFGAAATTVVALVLLLLISPLRVVARSSDGAPNALLGSRPLMGFTATAFQVGTYSPTGSLSAFTKVEGLPAPLDAQRLQAPSQTADAAAPSFAVVSVKPGAGVFGLHSGPIVSGPDFTWRNAQLRWLIEWAYGVDQYQIIGQPSWVGGPPSDGAEYFDIAASADAPASADGMRQMLRTLLADRFNLKVHTESRDEPIYALVVAGPDGSLGPNIHPATADCKTLREAAEREGRKPGPNYFPCGNHVGIGQGSARGMNIATLAGIVSRDAGRKVVDETGLDGIYDWDLTWTPEPLRHHPPDRFTSVDPEGPSIFTAVEAQLGLRLEPQEHLRVVLVIDRVEHPTPD